MTSRSKPTPATPAPFLGRKVVIQLRAPLARIGDPDTGPTSPIRCGRGSLTTSCCAVARPSWSSPSILAQPTGKHERGNNCQAGITGRRP